MFIEKEDLYTAIQEYILANITINEDAVRAAILSSIQEATSYLNSKYDCQAIFNAIGDERNQLVLEHCKSIAVWYLLRLSNADVIFEKTKDYYTLAVDWLEKVAGVSKSGKTIAPDLPLKKKDGEVQLKMRFGSNRKFRHSFDD